MGILITTFCVLVITTSVAHAYIDPSAGTFILQIIAAAALGVAFYFRQGISAIKRLFGGDRHKGGDDERPADDKK